MEKRCLFSHPEETVPYTFRKTELIHEKMRCRERWVEKYPQCLFLGPGRVLGFSRAVPCSRGVWLCKSWISPVTWCCPPCPCHQHSVPSRTPACPDICSCTDPKERSGTERASKTNQFPDGSNPWWSAFCCQPLDLQIRAETRGGGCSLLPFPSAAATPQHSHWEAGWQLVLHCLLQWLSTTLESHSQQLPLVSSDMAAGHGESGLLSERLKDSSLHMDCLEDAIPAHGSAGGCHPSMQSSLHFNLQ